MKFKYLGTAAAEGIPGLFCACDCCKKSMEAGGKNIRTRSQAIIDDKLLIDFPADTYMHVLYQGLKLAEIHSCIITHSHSDHLYPADLEMRRVGFAHFEPKLPFKLYSSLSSGKGIENIINTYNLHNDNRVQHESIAPFTPVIIEGYKVTAYPANHDKNCEPYFYSISDGKNTVLYANDTGYFNENVWEYLGNNKPYFNLVSLDCTAMVLKGWRNGHMGLDTNIEVRERLIQTGCADGNTVFVINHFSHNGGCTHDELEKIAEEDGFLVAYDGMEIVL